MVCLALMPAYLCHIHAAQDTTVTVTFAGSAGYIVKSATKKISVDAFYEDRVTSFGAAFPSEAILDSMEACASPYDSLDLILISHSHAGHFDAARVLNAMNMNPEAILVSTPGVKEALLADPDAKNGIGERIFAPALADEESKDTTISGIPLGLTCIGHRDDLDLFLMEFNLDGMQMAYFIGFIPDADLHPWSGGQKIDIGLLEAGWITDASSAYQDYYEIEYCNLTHLNSITSTRKSLRNTIAEQELENVHFMSSVMDIFQYTKEGGELRVDTINLGPELAEPVPDFEAMVNTPFSFTLDEGLIFNYNDEILEWQVIPQNGDESWPDWITYDATTHTLSGEYSEEEKIWAVLQLTDPFMSVTEDRFFIEIIDPNAIEKEESVTPVIFPNPGPGRFTLKLPDIYASDLHIAVYNISGVQIYEQYLAHTVSAVPVDLSSFPAGIYTLMARTSADTYHFRLIKE